MMSPEGAYKMLVNKVLNIQLLINEVITESLLLLEVALILLTLLCSFSLCCKFPEVVSVEIYFSFASLLALMKYQNFSLMVSVLHFKGKEKEE